MNNRKWWRNMLLLSGIENCTLRPSVHVVLPQSVKYIFSPLKFTMGAGLCFNKYYVKRTSRQHSRIMFDT